MKRVLWCLEGGMAIDKIGEGAQQVFATLTPQQRSDITLKCLRCIETDLGEDQRRLKEKIDDEFSERLDS